MTLVSPETPAGGPLSRNAGRPRAARSPRASSSAPLRTVDRPVMARPEPGRQVAVAISPATRQTAALRGSTRANHVSVCRTSSRRSSASAGSGRRHNRDTGRPPWAHGRLACYLRLDRRLSLLRPDRRSGRRLDHAHPPPPPHPPPSPRRRRRTGRAHRGAKHGMLGSVPPSVRVWAGNRPRSSLVLPGRRVRPPRGRGPRSR